VNLFHKIMSKLGRYRSIPNNRTSAVTLHRYYLFLKNRKWFPFNIVLNKIVSSDDPIFHDHPWSYLSVILSGGYWEHTPVFNENGIKFAEFSQWHGPGSVVRCKAGKFHWLELNGEQPVTTLCFLGPRQREWGYLVEAKKGKYRWVKNEYYIDTWKDYHDKYVVPKTTRKEKL